MPPDIKSMLFPKYYAAIHRLLNPCCRINGNSRGTGQKSRTISSAWRFVTEHDLKMSVAGNLDIWCWHIRMLPNWFLNMVEDRMLLLHKSRLASKRLL